MRFFCDIVVCLLLKSLEEIVKEFSDSLTSCLHISVKVVSSLRLMMSRMRFSFIVLHTVCFILEILLVPFGNNTFVLHCDALHFYIVCFAHVEPVLIISNCKDFELVRVPMFRIYFLQVVFATWKHLGVNCST